MDNIFDSIAKQSKNLIFREPFYGLFLIALNKEISKDKTQTACVSKNRINNQLTINPDFWEKIDQNTQLAVLKHELLHIGFFHLIMHNDYEDKELFNVAADLEINQYIEKELKGPTWPGLEIDGEMFKPYKLPPKAGTREYYDLLKKDVNTGKSPKFDQFYNGMKEGKSEICSHEGWKEFEGMSEAEKKLIQKQIDHQLKELAQQIKNKSRGTIPGEFQSYIDSLFQEEEAVIDWKAYLRRFAGLSTKVYTKKTRRKLNKRYEENPALKVKQRKHILCAIDTSGSVSDSDLIEFFNEINHIYKTGTTITICECDAQVGNVYDYKGKVPERVSGRGGTSFQPVIDFLEENKNKYSILIYLTDGECSAPTKPCKPTLWVICSSGSMREDLPGQKVKITR
jgi:predicted metal-dependent peptidase